MNETAQTLRQALWRIYRRAARPLPWAQGGNLPWDDPEFSARMLREHLNESHGAASRQLPERQAQIDWLWQKLNLQPGQRVLDVTCGPGLYAVELARRGCLVTGVDFSPAAIAYAQELAQAQGVNGRCTFIQQDVRQMNLEGQKFDAALFLYGQLAVFTRNDARALLAQIAQSLQQHGRLAVELLNQDKVDKKESRWWYTDETGLWGDAPYLHLGERFWYPEERLSLERFLILHLETGQLDEIQLCDQTYAVPEMLALMQENGFSHVESYLAWGDLPLYDAEEWVVYVAER